MPKKRRKKSELLEFLESAEGHLKESDSRGEVVDRMTMSMTCVGDPADSILNETISVLNKRVDFIAYALQDLINMHYKCRRSRKHE